MLTGQEIKKALPHGSGKLIAKKAGVNAKAVSEYFSGKTNSKRVALAVVETLEEIKQKKNEFENRLQAALL